MIERNFDDETDISYKVCDSAYLKGGYFENDTITFYSDKHDNVASEVNILVERGSNKFGGAEESILLIMEEREFDELCAVIDRIREWRAGK